jgi:hypothetical protein
MTISAFLAPVLDDPGVVHQRMEPRLTGENGIGQMLGVGQDPEISQIEPGVRTPGGFHFRQHGFATGAVTTMYQDSGTTLGQGDRDAASEPISSPGDGDDLAG